MHGKIGRYTCSTRCVCVLLLTKSEKKRVYLFETRNGNRKYLVRIFFLCSSLITYLSKLTGAFFYELVMGVWSRKTTENVEGEMRDRVSTLIKF